MIGLPDGAAREGSAAGDVYASRSRVWSRLRPPRRPEYAALGIGIVLGVALTLLLLLAVAPQPSSALPQPRSGSDIMLSFNDAYLTQVVVTALNDASLPFDVTNVQAQIYPNNRISITGDLPGIPGIDRRFSAIANVYVRNGALAVRISDAYVGGLPLPGAVTTSLEKPINAQLQQMSDNLLPRDAGYTINSVSTTAHRITITIGRAD